MRDVQSMTDAGGHSRASEGHAGGIAVVNDANLSVVSKHPIERVRRAILSSWPGAACVENFDPLSARRSAQSTIRRLDMSKDLPAGRGSWNGSSGNPIY